MKIVRFKGVPHGTTETPVRRGREIVIKGVDVRRQHETGEITRSRDDRKMNIDLETNRKLKVLYNYNNGRIVHVTFRTSSL